MNTHAIDTLPRGQAPGNWRAGPPSIATGLLAQARGLAVQGLTWFGAGHAPELALAAAAVAAAWAAGSIAALLFRRP